MKLNLRELRILSRLFCYDNKLELTKKEIDEGEFDRYISDWDYLKQKIEDWFFDYLDEKIDILKVTDKELYIFRNDYVELDNHEVKELLDKIKTEYKINSIEDFNYAKNKIFEENNYDSEIDCFEDYDDFFEEYDD